MKILKTLLLSVALMLMMVSCKKKETVANTYEGCCGNVPLSGQIGNVKFNIANVYTPNGDGYNDMISISAGSDIGKVTDFIVKDKNNVEVFRGSSTFNGANYNILMTNSENAKIPEGLLNYTFKLTPSTGNATQFQGSICKNTSKGTDCPATNSKCLFSSQNDRGTFNRSLPSNEACK